ncbi:MAG: amidohydrolase [Blastocatellia bacterium]|nr:amidohydrolase [Blastocatellia bacterium]MCS7158587.1 amidohydrolase [Blastocatellia bacterium]MDW8169287.1 amidohydrolase family protein [Acidobacteriota bacterium]MDW8257783.1 amidohydrolase family protein [Acidobacteriota bacterium]
MNWRVLDEDRELFARELETFIPPRLFDAHAHLYEVRHFSGHIPPLCAEGPERVGMEIYQALMTEMFPQRRIEGLFFGFPNASLDLMAANDFVVREARRRPHSRAQMLIRPDMDPELIRETVRREGFVGLKCYHVYAAERPTFEATIPSYLPEEHVRIAHEERLTITLHIVRSRALADPANQEAIRQYAKRYPDARFILAHAGRGFNPHHTVMGIEALRGLGNLWFDTSAVTECGAFEAILRIFGVDRLLYGSDFPVSHMRGRCVAVGDSFLWLSAHDLSRRTEYADIRPVLVGIESLRVLKLAALNLRLSDSQIEALFFGNAVELLGVGGG